jgi:uncharacterized membrane protein
MDAVTTEKKIHATFLIGIFLKGLHAVLEILGGVFAFVTTKQAILSFVTEITSEELGEDSKDLFAHYLIKTANNLSISGQNFVALYLLSHGVVKLFVIIVLFKRKLWAYPLSVFVFSLFIIYQLYRYTFTHSFWLLLFTFFDVIIIILTIYEWRFVKAEKLL